MLKEYWYVWAAFSALGIVSGIVFRKGLKEDASVKEKIIFVSIATLTILPLYFTALNLNSFTNSKPSSPTSIISDLKNFTDTAQKTIEQTNSLKNTLTGQSPTENSLKVDDKIYLADQGGNQILLSPDKETLISLNRYILDNDSYNVLKMISDKKIFSIKQGALGAVKEIDTENKILSVKITSLSKEDENPSKNFVNKNFWVNITSASLEKTVENGGINQ